MAKKKKDNRPGQRPGNKHSQPPKLVEAPTTAPIVSSQPIAVHQPQGMQNQKVKAGKKSRSDDEQYYRLEVWQHRFTAALVLVAFVSAGIAVWQGWVTNKQLVTMREQNVDTKRQADLALKATEQTDKTLDLMRLEQRPWVAMTSVELAEPLQVGRKVKPLFSFKNSGSHPARITFLLGASGGLVKGDSPEKLIRDFEALAPIEDVALTIPPGGEIVTTMDLVELDKLALDAINLDVASLIVIGRITYTDPTNPGSRYTTRFMHQHIPQGRGIAQFTQRGEYTHMD